MSTQLISKFATKIFAVVLAAAPLTAASHAQNQTVRVNLPFAFETTSKHLPAGLYTIQVEDGHVLAIHGRSGGTLAIYMPDADRTPAEKGKIVFNKRGGQYFLRDIYLPGSYSHAHCYQSKREKNMTLASVAVPDRDVEVALLETPR